MPLLHSVLVFEILCLLVGKFRLFFSAFGSMFHSVPTVSLLLHHLWCEVGIPLHYSQQRLFQTLGLIFLQLHNKWWSELLLWVSWPLQMQWGTGKAFSSGSAMNYGEVQSSIIQDTGCWQWHLKHIQGFSNKVLGLLCIATYNIMMYLSSVKNLSAYIHVNLSKTFRPTKNFLRPQILIQLTFYFETVDLVVTKWGKHGTHKKTKVCLCNGSFWPKKVGPWILKLH